MKGYSRDRIQEGAGGMTVTVEVSPGTVKRIGSAGAHELLWRILLDRIFADAEAHGIARLYVFVPDAQLVPPVEFRAQLTSLAVDEEGPTAIAWLNGEFTSLIRADRVYTLTRGVPWICSQVRVARRAGWVMDSAWFLQTWRARALGLFIRAFASLRWPYWQDRALFAARGAFVSHRPTWSKWVLTMWSPPADHDRIAVASRPQDSAVTVR